MTTDAQLTALFQAGAYKNVFDVLVDRYSKPLYHQIRTVVRNHEDADDVLQNTFIKVWKALPEFRGDAAFFTWLYRIATNEALNHVRKNHKYSGQEVPPTVNGSLDAPDATTIQQQFEVALQKLPPKQALVFKMRYFDELSYEQISEILGTSVGALKASYHHAVQKIKTHLTTH
jgi:RNA polymerase sigma-70 factor (ECF subfamily)